MNCPNRYATSAAFRQALERRINQMATSEHVDVQRYRRQVAFDRLLVRLFESPDSPWVLKGGYAMELRIESPRTTRDIDLTLIRPIETAIPDLLIAA